MRDIVTTVISIAASLALVGILLAAIGINPFEAYAVMFTRTFTSKFGIAELCVKTTPLILTGLAVAIPLRAGLWNIGAEGQLYMGAFAASVVALYSGLPGYAMLPAMFAAGALFGMGWAAIPAVLKAKFDLNEIISTLLLNYVAIYWVEYMVYGPMRGKEVYNFPYTDLFPDAATLPRFFGTRFHLGFIIAIVIALVIYYIINKTDFGFSLKVVGANPKAADYAGISRQKMIIYSLLLGGMLAGIAG